MKIEMGESLFYSWLRHVKECQIVQTNWKVSPQWVLQNEDELQRLYNVFEDVLDRRARDINAIKSTLLSCGAYGACMSGTGSAVFGIFPDSVTARSAANTLAQLHRETFLTKTIGALTHM